MSIQDNRTSTAELTRLSGGLFLILTLIGLFAVTAILVVSYSYLSNFGTDVSNQHEHWGQFGDYFGGTLNPVLGLATLLLLVLTVVLQWKVLTLTRAELELTRKELHDSAAALNSQAKHQNIESEKKDLRDALESVASEIERHLMGTKTGGRLILETEAGSRIAIDANEDLYTALQSKNATDYRIAPCGGKNTEWLSFIFGPLPELFTRYGRLIARIEDLSMVADVGFMYRHRLSRIAVLLESSGYLEKDIADSVRSSDNDDIALRKSSRFS